MFINSCRCHCHYNVNHDL